MSTQATVLSAVGIGIVCAGAWVAWVAWEASQAKAAGTGATSPPAAQQQRQQQPQVPKPMVASDTRPAPEPQQNPRDTSLMTRLPDGSYIPNLNGVRQPMSWNGQFSPIVRINRTDTGVDWWVHENGLHSTVYMVEGTRRGVPVREAALLKAFPLPARPTYQPPKK